MKLYSVFLLFAWCGIALGSDNGSGAGVPRAFNRSGARRTLFFGQGAQKSPLVPTAAAASSSPIPAHLLSVPPLMLESAACDMPAHKDFFSDIVERLAQAQNIQELICCHSKGAIFAQVVKRACAIGDPKLLQDVLHYNKKDPIGTIQAPIPSRSSGMEAFFSIPVYHDDPVCYVYTSHEGTKRFELLKVLAADPRADLSSIEKKAEAHKNLQALALCHGGVHMENKNIIEYLMQRASSSSMVLPQHVIAKQRARFLQVKKAAAQPTHPSLNAVAQSAPASLKDNGKRGRESEDDEEKEQTLKKQK